MRIGSGKSHPRLAILAASASMLLSAAVTAAEPPASSEELRLDEVVVTAQKEAQPLQTVPISIKAISAATLERINAESADDYLRSIPSVAMTNLARGGNQIQIRGLGSNVGNVGTVAIYNDGVISPGRIQAGGAFAEQDPALFDVERVEVLRGPQGTLYGEGSFGGVINIISKRPSLDHVQASFSGSWFSAAHGSADNQDVAGMLSFPLVKGKLGLRFVGYRYDHDGWIDQVGPVIDALFLGAPMQLLKEDANTERVTGGRAVATLAASESVDVTLILKSEKLRTGALPVVSSNLIELGNAAGGTDFDPDYAQADYFASEQHSETNQGVLELNADLGAAKLTSVGGYGEVKSGSSSGVKGKNTAWNEELRLASNAEGAFNWIVGAYHRSADYELDFTGIPLAGNEVKDSAAFGQVYWKFAPLWTATFGLRYEHQKSEVVDKLSGLSSRATFHSTVPKLAVDYQRNDTSLWYASAAKGFRGGGANIDESIGTDPRFRAPFDPDTIWNYEIGAKTSFLERRLTVNAALFYIDWKNIQIDQPIDSLLNPPVGFIILNGKQAHSYGIETDIYFSPTPQWTMSAGASVLNAEYDNGAINSPAGAFALNGQVLPSTPKYTANASVERRFIVGSASEVYLRGDYSIRGSSFGDVPNDPEVGFFGVGRLASGASRITNIRAGLRHGDWEAQIFCTNLFDARDSTFTVYDGSFTDLNALLRPRMIGISLRARYN